MSNSQLINYTRILPYKNSPRNHKIDTITIHCTAGQCSVEGLGNTLYDNKTSANYGIGADGRIGLYVNESDRSWCSSSATNDNRAVTIEVASDSTHPYAVNSKAYESLIKLLVDICQRNGIKQLLWKGDKLLIGQIDKQNMTVHRWFANKACPGDYLYNLHPQIAKEVNAKLGNQTTSTITNTTAFKPYLVKVTATALNIRSIPSTSGSITGQIRDMGVYTIVNEMNGWGQLKSGAGWISLDYTKKV